MHAVWLRTKVKKNKKVRTEKRKVCRGPIQKGMCTDTFMLTMYL